MTATTVSTTCASCGSPVIVWPNAGTCPECGAAFPRGVTQPITASRPEPARIASPTNVAAMRSRPGSFATLAQGPAQTTRGAVRPGTPIPLPGDFGLTQNLCGSCGQPVKTSLTAWGSPSTCSSCGAQARLGMQIPDNRASTGAPLSRVGAGRDSFPAAIGVQFPGGPDFSGGTGGPSYDALPGLEGDWELIDYRIPGHAAGGFARVWRRKFCRCTSLALLPPPGGGDIPGGLKNKDGGAYEIPAKYRIDGSKTKLGPNDDDDHFAYNFATQITFAPGSEPKSCTWPHQSIAATHQYWSKNNSGEPTYQHKPPPAIGDPSKGITTTEPSLSYGPIGALISQGIAYGNFSALDNDKPKPRNTTGSGGWVDGPGLNAGSDEAPSDVDYNLAMSVDCRVRVWVVNSDGTITPDCDVRFNINGTRAGKPTPGQAQRIFLQRLRADGSADGPPQ